MSWVDSSTQEWSHVASLSWTSYPSTYQLGHKALEGLLSEPVLVEEKIDGSQFSFGVFLRPEGSQPDVARVELPGFVCVKNGETLYYPYLLCRSKGAQLNLVAPEKMFQKAIDTARELAPQLVLSWTYRAEYLAKPKHNSLSYDRVPARHLILFDVCTGAEQYLDYDAKATEAARLGLEVVPRFYEGLLYSQELFREMLDRVSVLGGQRVEGVVVKNYARFGLDKKVLVGKFVSEHFKEVHAREWKQSNPNSGDVVQLLVEEYGTPARWEKAALHLAEAGKLSGELKDIGELMREAPRDVEGDSADEIKEKLWRWAWPKVRRGIVAGLPAWYKELLLKRQFAADDDPAPQLAELQRRDAAERLTVTEAP